MDRGELRPARSGIDRRYPPAIPLRQVVIGTKSVPLLRSSRTSRIIGKTATPTDNAMPFAIKTTDKPGKEELRKKLGPAHLDYLDRQMDILLAAAERFINNDPFAKGRALRRDHDR